MIDRIMIALQASKQRPNYWIAILLPIYFATSQLYLRSQAGPFWQWNLLDPSYFYLFDGLNLLNGDTPGHIYHPGVTVHAFNAILIWLHELITSDRALRLAFLEPERYLYFLSDAVIILNSLALVIVGIIGHKIFRSWLPALVCQLAPFTSSIILKHAFLPKPEALLVFSTIAIISLSLLALREALSSSGQKLNLFRFISSLDSRFVVCRVDGQNFGLRWFLRVSAFCPNQLCYSLYGLCFFP